LHTGFWWGNRRERAQLQDLGVNGRIISKHICKKFGGHGLELAEDRDKWHALMNMVMYQFIIYSNTHKMYKITSFEYI
jgi:hypothetical protein